VRAGERVCCTWLLLLVRCSMRRQQGAVCGITTRVAGTVMGCVVTHAFHLDADQGSFLTTSRKRAYILSSRQDVA
jgi:hypothetical protein